MEKANSSRITLSMVDGKFDGQVYGYDQELGFMLCKATLDFLKDQPQMYKPVRRAMRKVYRELMADRFVKWVADHSFLLFKVAFGFVLLVCCVNI